MIIYDIYNFRGGRTVKYLTIFVMGMLVLALGGAVSGCKKGEAPTAEPSAETAAETIAQEEVTCPAPGQDLICEECGILFQGASADKDYAAHMEEKHPEKWAKIKDEFWKMREGKGGK
jgi:hypothetical protein